MWMFKLEWSLSSVVVCHLERVGIELQRDDEEMAPTALTTHSSQGGRECQTRIVSDSEGGWFVPPHSFDTQYALQPE